MSTQSRTAPRGGRNAKPDAVPTLKTQKNDAKSDPPKTLDNPKTQPTAEQMRIAQIIDTRTDDTCLRAKVKEIMDATQKTEDEAIAALHDCDNDANKAVNMLLEGEGQGAWETSVKKKKNRQPSTSKTGENTPNNRTGGDTETDENDPLQQTSNTDRERSRPRGGPPRMRGRGDNRGWRGRENKENEQNQEEVFNRNRGEGGPRRGRGGMANGPRSGRGRGSRGGGGQRTFQTRDKSGGFPRSIETWNNPGAENSADNIKMENWDDFPSPEDWDNEEYTGSLADSKVFTPSSSTDATPPQQAPQQEPLQDTSNQEILGVSNASQDYLQSSQLGNSPLQVPVGTLSAAQSQYLSQLTAQAENLKSAVGIGNSSNTYGPGTGGSYGQSANNSTSYGQQENLKSAVGIGSNAYNQATAASAYQTAGSGATYGQTSGYGPTTGGTYQGSSSSYQTQGYGQTASTGASYGQPGQTNYSGNSAFQSSSNAASYGQSATYPGAGNASNYQSSTGSGGYSSTGAANSYQSSGTNVFPASGTGSGNYSSTGTAYSSSTNAVYAGSGASGAGPGYQTTSGSGSSYQNQQTTGSYQNNANQQGFQNSTSYGTQSQSSSYSAQTYGANVNNYVSQIPDGSVNANDSTQSSQPARTKSQRARVPPPSKIPQSAVEMPEDSINANISFLDVQFGGLEFGSESSSFETSNEQQNKFQTSSSVSATPVPVEQSVAVTSANIDITSSQTSTLDGYSSTSSGSTAVKNNQATLVSALTGKSVLSGNDALLQSSSDHKNSYSAPPSRVTSSTSGLDLSKSEVGLSYTTPSTANYQTYQSQNKTSSSVVYQPSYSTANYSSTTPQVTSTTSYTTPQNQNYSTSSSATNTYNNQTGGSGANNYQNSSYSQSTNVNYQSTSNSYPISQSSNSYQNTSQTYQNSGQSVYGSGYSSTSQYQANYGSNSSQNKLTSALTNAGKDGQDYTAPTTTGSNLSSTISSTTNSGLTNSSTQPLGLTSTSQTASTTSTKATNASNKSGVVPNIPAGVPPMMGTQYIMSQTGMPYFQPTPAVYSYEELQLLQQRIPHVQTGYYDMTYPAPTSLATGRDNLASVAYTMSDARYTRGDNNASPVPSTLSQQPATQAHQQPMMNPHSLPPGYAFYYGTGMMPGSFQYGTPLYPLPTVTNAHGTTTTTQYPKPTTYGSAYGSGYDGLSQAQDYSKSAYISTNQTQSKTGVGVTAGSSASNTTELNASVYGKSHTALGKVNSYEKQGFHSGTPPPFNLAANQNTGMAPSGGYPPLFIPLTAHQQHHGTTLMHQPLHQDNSSSGAQRTQSSTQSNKTGNKQSYNPYWSPN